MRLQVLHGVPLVDERLVRGDPALIVADPGEEQAAREVVVTAGHFAGFMEGLQCRPLTERVKPRYCMIEQLKKNIYIYVYTYRDRTAVKTGVTHHMACTDTGLKMCTLLSVDTLKPLWANTER